MRFVDWWPVAANRLLAAMPSMPVAEAAAVEEFLASQRWLEHRQIHSNVSINHRRNAVCIQTLGSVQHKTIFRPNRNSCCSACKQKQAILQKVARGTFGSANLFPAVVISSSITKVQFFQSFNFSPKIENNLELFLKKFIEASLCVKAIRKDKIK